MFTIDHTKPDYVSCNVSRAVASPGKKDNVEVLYGNGMKECNSFVSMC